MAEDQGTRIVVCSKHKIPYDASKRGGCSRCIQEWEREKRTGSEGVPAIVKLLGVLVVVAGLFVFFNRQSAQAPPPPVPADAEVPQEPASSGDDAREKALRDILKELPRLIDSGRSEADFHLTDTDQQQRRAESWQFWSEDWIDRVRRLRERLPLRPDSKTDAGITAVYQEVVRALDELRAIPEATDGQGLPDDGRVPRHFFEAEKAVQEARLQLSRLHR